MGAVAYDPKVVTIWDGFQQYFRSRGLEFDYVLYLELRAAGRGAPLGADARRLEFPAGLAADRAGRATARPARRGDLHARHRSRSDLGHPGPGRQRRSRRSPTCAARRVAVGASDSPQATLIPLSYLADQGLRPDEDFRGQVFDVLVGKHGDHIGGERDAVRALIRGEADAACIIDANHLAFAREGTHPQRDGAYSRADAALRSLQLHRARWRAHRSGRPLPRAAAGDVVRRRRGPSAARPRRAEAVGARAGQRIRAACPRPIDRFRTIDAVRQRPAGAMRVDLGTLGFAEGGYLLVKRALRAGGARRQRHRPRHGAGAGGRPARVVRAEGHRFEWRPVTPATTGRR